MADITLSTLRDYWKRLSDWVQGNTSDKPDVQVRGGSQFLSGHKTVASSGSANAELLHTDQEVLGGVYLKADTGSDVSVYPTDGGSKSDVDYLDNSDYHFFPVNNLNLLTVEVDTNGNGVYWRAAL